MKTKTNISLLVLLAGVYAISSQQLSVAMETKMNIQQKACLTDEDAETTISQEELEFFYNDRCKPSLLDLIEMPLYVFISGQGIICQALYNKHFHTDSSNANRPIRKYSREQWQYTSGAYWEHKKYQHAKKAILIGFLDELIYQITS